MNDFQIRLGRSEVVEEEARRLLAIHAKAVALNGTEHTHPDFAAMLRSNTSLAALFVRYAPDGIMLIGDRVIYFDVKAAQSIEKAAWETYQRYVAAGCVVMLLIKHNNSWYKQYVEKISLINGEESIKRYPPDRRFPVDDDGWIHPRRSNRNVINDRMSGTPYKYINIQSLDIWDTSKSPLLFGIKRNEQPESNSPPNESPQLHFF